LTLLVDSSVWIDRLRDRATEATRFVDSRDASEDIALTALIYLEVLQGINTEAAYGRIQPMLAAIPVLQPQEGLATYELAAGLCRRARSQGLTIRKFSDCLIAAIALEHGAMLVHNDRDFLALAQVEPALQVFPGRPH
jgi:predicted nucleic acid-binding protein